MDHVIKINLSGGFVSAGDLYELLVIASNAGAQDMRFGNRQQLYFTIDHSNLEDLQTEMLSIETPFEVDADNHPNIVSSYVADAIFNQDGWLREGVYKDILDSFEYQPRLKINLVDNQQSLVPFFSGNINFIASDVSNYWYMYIRFPKSGKHFCSPWLIYSDDIPVVAQLCETIILQNEYLFYDQAEVDERDYFRRVSKSAKLVFTPVDQPLKLPDFYLPYYEGFNKYNNRYWLGIYRRNELFSIEFLKDLCGLCLQNRIGQVYTTPWKSILVKGIEPASRPDWGLILAKYRLNVRHAANELNWQIEDLSEEGLKLKKQLVKEFEEADLRTYQLCFAIKTQPKSGLTGSIVVKKNDTRYWDILHTKDFNPNSKAYTVYKKRVPTNRVGANLIRLCNEFYDTQGSLSVKPLQPIFRESNQHEAQPHEVYQCSHCLTRYDKAFGDGVNQIPAGVEFIELADYRCPVCDAGKEEFSLVAVH